MATSRLLQTTAGLLQTAERLVKMPPDPHSSYRTPQTPHQALPDPTRPHQALSYHTLPDPTKPYQALQDTTRPFQTLPDLPKALLRLFLGGRAARRRIRVRRSCRPLHSAAVFSSLHSSGVFSNRQIRLLAVLSLQTSAAFTHRFSKLQHSSAAFNGLHSSATILSSSQRPSSTSHRPSSPTMPTRPYQAPPGPTRP